MLKTNRNIIVIYLLSLITLGIYDLFLPGKFAKAINRACEGDGKKTRGFSVYLLSLITFGIYGIVYCVKLLNRTQQYYEKNILIANQLSLKSSVNGAFIFINFIPVLGSLIYFGHFLRNINNVCKIYNVKLIRNN